MKAELDPETLEPLSNGFEVFTPPFVESTCSFDGMILETKFSDSGDQMILGPDGVWYQLYEAADVFDYSEYYLDYDYVYKGEKTKYDVEKNKVYAFRDDLDLSDYDREFPMFFMEKVHENVDRGMVNYLLTIDYDSSW